MLRSRLREALTTALKAREELAVATLRLVLAALKDRDITARGKGNLDGIGDDDILEMLRSMIRQRHDSIELYEKGGRLELAEREAGEIAVIESFLPVQLDDGETLAAIGEVIAEKGAKDLKDLGRTMAALKKRYPGRMDFAKASALVKERLGG